MRRAWMPSHLTHIFTNRLMCVSCGHWIYINMQILHRISMTIILLFWDLSTFEPNDVEVRCPSRMFHINEQLLKKKKNQTQKSVFVSIPCCLIERYRIMQRTEIGLNHRRRDHWATNERTKYIVMFGRPTPIFAFGMRLASKRRHTYTHRIGMVNLGLVKHCRANWRAIRSIIQCKLG